MIQIVLVKHNAKYHLAIGGGDASETWFLCPTTICPNCSCVASDKAACTIKQFQPPGLAFLGYKSLLPVTTPNINTNTITKSGLITASDTDIYYLIRDHFNSLSALLDRLPDDFDEALINIIEFISIKVSESV